MTLYRRVGLLAETGLLEVEGEQQVNGAVDRRYRLRRELAMIDRDAAASTSLEAPKCRLEGSPGDRSRRHFRAKTAAGSAGRNMFLPDATMAGMTVRKLSISVPPEVEETIKAAAAEEGKPVSAWLAEAATEKAHAAALHAAGRAAARELVTEYESEHGPLPAESRQRAHQFLIEAGLIGGEPQRAAG